MRELKTPLNFSDQIERLIKYHNLTIDDPEKAISILMKVNYYRLSGYGIGLKKKDDKEKYRDGLKLEDLYSLYIFDIKLRNVIFHAIEHIEIKLRCELSYLLAIKYGAAGYLVFNNFECGKEKHDAFINKFYEEVNRQRNIPFVKHHIHNYDNRFPIWVAVELLSFGSLSKLYSYLKKEDKKIISKKYNTDPVYLNSWIQCLVEIRNICAHFNRLYNLPFKQMPSLYKENQIYLNKKGVHKLFPVILVMRRILNSNDVWEDLFDKLKQTIDEHKDVVNLSFMDFPSDWEKVLSSN